MMKRNIVVFEAPIELTEQVKKIADETYTSTSTICRQALAQYLTNINKLKSEGEK
jgi:predicted transcriptional regulator